MRPHETGNRIRAANAQALQHRRRPPRFVIVLSPASQADEVDRGKPTFYETAARAAMSNDDDDDLGVLESRVSAFERALAGREPSAEEASLLQEMKEHVRALHIARGTWNAPSTFRNWNNYGGVFEPKARRPEEIESYARYKEHARREEDAAAARMTRALPAPERVQGDRSRDGD